MADHRYVIEARQVERQDPTRGTEDSWAVSVRDVETGLVLWGFDGGFETREAALDTARDWIDSQVSGSIKIPRSGQRSAHRGGLVRGRQPPVSAERRAAHAASQETGSRPR
jgi:hypothetical protein